MRYGITPVAKPRMSRSDKWKKRPIVLKYWAFKDAVREAGIDINNCDHITFYIPMPKSWSKKKKAENYDKPHMQTPDIDNLAKALLDAHFDDDSHIWDIRLTKLWSYEGGISITPMD